MSSDVHLKTQAQNLAI